jgi:cob(I)alamin adenosyltransferase
MPIYTRTGDDGSTGLFGGARVPKDHPRLMAYGSLDELGSILGVLALQVSQASDVSKHIERIQNDLFALSAMLATPPEHQAKLDARMIRGTWPLDDMEADIDRLTALAPPLKGFVLPGGCPGSAFAHLARTFCRRAERDAVALSHQDVPCQEVLTYLNRLSDWLFALARAENALAGISDREWRSEEG